MLLHVICKVFLSPIKSALVQCDTIYVYYWVLLIRTITICYPSATKRQVTIL